MQQDKLSRNFCRCYKLYRKIGFHLAGLARCELTFCTKEICAEGRRHVTRQGVR